MDPAKMKVVDLRSELGALGLDTKGNKPALVERLKKALETKTGRLVESKRPKWNLNNIKSIENRSMIPDTSILDTTSEDSEDTPKRPGPAARTRRRSSSTRLPATPAKHPRRDSPEPIAEETKDQDRYSPGGASSGSDERPRTPEPARETSDNEDTPIESSANEAPVKQSSEDREKSPIKIMDEDLTQSPVTIKEDVDDRDGTDPNQDSEIAAEEDNAEEPEQKDKPVEKTDEEKEKELLARYANPDISEEEEWELLNVVLQQKEKDRLEREKKQAEDDAKKLEELSNDPIRLNRLKRKYEKKQRWSNFYRSVEVTNEVLTPPTEEESVSKGKGKGKKETAPVEIKFSEPEIDDSKITLSWYDSDLNQYLEVPSLNSVMPLNDGAFAHAWAGARASHGVTSGRVCYEVRVGAAATTTESGDKEVISQGLRIGWSTDDQSLHLGDGARSWGFESTGRSVHNGEFKEYGKKLEEKDVVGVYLDLESKPCKMLYTLNGIELGVAYEFDKSDLDGKPLFPHVLTKNMCYRVNMGYDRYNMLTKTKIVRNRIEIPIEKVLEEKRAREEEIQRQKAEAQRREKERREKERLEREERQKKKREEREKAEREKKEKEAAERRERGEEVEEEDKDKDKDKEKEGEKAPQENGDKAEEVVGVKQEPMETDQSPVAAAEPVAAPVPAPAPAPAPPAEIKGEPDVVELTEDQVLKGHVLDKRIKFVIRYTADEELDGSEADLLPGYVLIAQGNLVEGPTRPADIASCEVILMVGMPGAGKTYWAKQRDAAFPERRYNILSTGALFDKMKVDCKPYRATYEGRWDAMVSKCAKCVLKLVELSHGRRRNFILDQTNVYPSAQRRKLREFEGYRRIAVCVVPDEETYKERLANRETHDGKEVPDPAIMDMKANFTLPEKCSWVDEVMYPELNEEEAKKIIEAYHKEAKAAGVMREREKRDRSAEKREAPAAKRNRSQDKRRDGRDDRGRSRDFNRGDREDRWGGGGGGNRWGGGGGGRGGGGGGGGMRWGRERDQQPRGFQDRWGPPNRGGGGGDYGSRERDNFRGGRGGGGGPPRGGNRGPPPPAPDRFSRDRGSRGPPPPALPDKRPNQSAPAGGAMGSWQRGGQVAASARGGGGGGGGSARGNLNSRPPNQKDNNANQNQNQQQTGWNQWAGGWGGWGNWNQNQAANWNNWQNWQNWNQQGNATGGQQQQQNQQQQVKGASQQQGQQNQSASAQGQGQGQWPANYTAQQWYQWQQWQQQQQSWAGYQQQQQGATGGTGGNQATNAQDAQAAWAQYYQNYGNAAANASNAVTGGDKKS